MQPVKGAQGRSGLCGVCIGAWMTVDFKVPLCKAPVDKQSAPHSVPGM